MQLVQFIYLFFKICINIYLLPHKNSMKIWKIDCNYVYSIFLKQDWMPIYNSCLLEEPFKSKPIRWKWMKSPLQEDTNKFLSIANTDKRINGSLQWKVWGLFVPCNATGHVIEYIVS